MEKISIFLGACLLLFSCAQQNSNHSGADGSQMGEVHQASIAGPGKDQVGKSYPITKSDQEWRALLTPEQYYIVREKGTERAFSGKFNNFKQKGVFTCVACGNELFSSDTKYDSRSGWPSFYAPVSARNVEEQKDRSMGMVRVEVLCSQCGGHLGHVFDDGPKPTGLRYCINSAALGFKKEGKE
jgi:peptide-methionine (R)-S-oxide reductase